MKDVVARDRVDQPVGDPLAPGAAGDRARRANFGQLLRPRHVHPVGRARRHAELAPRRDGTCRARSRPSWRRRPQHSDDIGVAGMVIASVLGPDGARSRFSTTWSKLMTITRSAAAGRLEQIRHRSTARSGRSASLISSTMPISSRFAQSSASASVGISSRRSADENRRLRRASGSGQGRGRRRSRGRRWCGRP